ncbi:uncharacterized protein LOC144683486 [Cetorhinus maximus]
MPEIKVLTDFENRAIQLAGDDRHRSCADGEVDGALPTEDPAVQHPSDNHAMKVMMPFQMDSDMLPARSILSYTSSRSGPIQSHRAEYNSAADLRDAIISLTSSS